MVIRSSVGNSGIPRLGIKVQPTKYPNIRWVVGQNAYLVGKGCFGGKAKGLLLLGSWQYQVQPFVALQSEWLLQHKSSEVRELSQSDLKTIKVALSFIGFKGGPLAVRSDHPYESMGIDVAQASHQPARLANPAGLLGTQLIIHNPASPLSNTLLAEAIKEVCDTSENKDFAAFQAKFGLEHRPSSVILQPFIYTSKPFRDNFIYPHYSALVDTARHDMVRVCAGFGSGTFAFNRRGQGFVHRYDPHTLEPIEEQSRGGQSHFEVLDSALERPARLDFTDYFSSTKIKEMREFFQDPSHFLHLARIGREMTLRYPKGLGICVEAAAAETTSEPRLLQLNQIRKMKLSFDRPNIPQERILYETHFIIGQGHQDINGIVVVIVPERFEKATINIHAELERVNQQLKNYLLIIPGHLTSQGLGTAMKYRLFSNAAAVMEYGSDIHETGTGMDHFTRICNTGGIFYIESSFQFLSDLKMVMGRKFEPIKNVSGAGVHRIDTDALSLWVNEEADHGRGDGIIYLKSAS